MFNKKEMYGVSDEDYVRALLDMGEVGSAVEGKIETLLLDRELLNQQYNLLSDYYRGHTKDVPPFVNKEWAINTIENLLGAIKATNERKLLSLETTLTTALGVAINDEVISRYSIAMEFYRIALNFPLPLNMDEDRKHGVIHILDRAQNWATTRNLDKAPFDVTALCNNVLSEREEVYTDAIEVLDCLPAVFTNAQINEAIEHKAIDALCDQLVFIMVDMFKKDSRVAVTPMSYARPIDLQFSLIYLDDTPSVADVCRIADELEANLDIVEEHDVLDLTSYILSVQATIEGMGYNFFKCMDETFNEIDTRKGSYDPSIGKWVKEKSDITYNADYAKCKRPPTDES